MSYAPLRSRATLAPLLIALFALAACHSPNKKPPHEQPPASVRVATARHMDVPVTVSASGIVEPLQTVAIQAQISGALLSVEFREGDFVRAGQILFRLDARAFEAAAAQARAALAGDVAQAEAARLSDARYQALARQDYVSRDQADQVHATALAAAATVASSRAALRAAQVSLGYAVIRAPISGRTGALLTRVGDIVGPGSGPLVVINQLQPIRVRFPVLSVDLALLRAAVAMHTLPATATATDSTPITEHGQLAFLDNAVDTLTGTVTGKASFQNTANRLWPGQLVVLTVRAGTQMRALVVPAAAILVGQQGSYLYVVDPQQKTARARNVVVGRSADTLAVVLSGLSAGEIVVTDGQARLTPGAHVVIVSGAGAPAAGQGAGAAGAPAAMWSVGGGASGAPPSGAPAAQPAPGASGSAVQPSVSSTPAARPATTTTPTTAPTTTPAPTPILTPTPTPTPTTTTPTGSGVGTPTPTGTGPT